MRDYLAWRLAFGVTTPSTNTVVQPEYDDMRPEGVTNHLARMVIADDPVTSDADFERQMALSGRRPAEADALCQVNLIADTTNPASASPGEH